MKKKILIIHKLQRRIKLKINNEKVNPIKLTLNESHNKSKRMLTSQLTMLILRKHKKNDFY